MTHLRNRDVLKKLIKRLKYFPVVAIQGARQTGKSFLARELFAKKTKGATYITFDQISWVTKAKEQPHTLLAEEKGKPLVIDEAQKVVEIFDAIKYEVDLKRSPGKYLLLGSTEFSLLTKIRESLTGRLGRIRVYPMSITETLAHHFKKKLTRAQVLQYLKSGGMPAAFSIRDESARDAYFEDWLKLTCQRDIHQIKTLKLDSELSFNILNKCALLEVPSKSNIAKALRVDARKIENHLKALCEIFVLQKINSHSSCLGPSLYFPIDVGIGKFLGASFERCLQIFVMNERLCKNSYFDEKQKQFYYYKSVRGKYIGLIEESVEGKIFAIQVFLHEKINLRDAALMKAFIEKNKSAKGVVLAPVLEDMIFDGIEFSPWEKILELT